MAQNVDPKLLETVNRQLLFLDREHGSDAIATDVISALGLTLGSYTGDTSHRALLAELHWLHDLLLECRPRIPNVIHDIQETILYVHNNPAARIADTQGLLRGGVREKAERRRLIGKIATELFSEPRTVLLHSYSSTLSAFLEQCAANAVRPKVFVAQQAPSRTSRILLALDRGGYEYTVVSEYSLSHVLKQIDLAIFSALTLTTNQELVMAPGSSSLVAHLNDAGVRTYVILSTNKWSFWEEDTPTTFEESREKQLGSLRFRKQVFSHDWVALDRIAGVITELGILAPEAALEVYRRKQREFSEAEALIASLEIASG